MKRNMTCEELLKAASLHPYLLCRHWKGKIMGLNSKIAGIAQRKGNISELNNETEFIGIIPCSFMDYISHKKPFI